MGVLPQDALAATDRGADRAVRPLLPAMRWMLVIAACFVFIAGIQTFILAEQTERFFAWTIKLPLTAAFLGAGYWASGVLEWLASRQRNWAGARPGVPAVWLFTTLTMVLSVVHYDLFRTESFWAWAWFNVYFIVPVALGTIWILQVRRPGGDPPSTGAIAPALRIACAVHLLLLLPLGLALYLAPSWASDVWPWALTDLTGRATGAWLIGWSVVLIGILLENDRARTHMPALSYAVWGGLALVAIARYSSALDWDAGRSWLLLVFFVSVIGVGSYGVIQARSQREPGVDRLK